MSITQEQELPSTRFGVVGDTIIPHDIVYPGQAELAAQVNELFDRIEHYKEPQATPTEKFVEKSGSNAVRDTIENSGLYL